MIKAVNLKTEYLVNPVGIDILQPRFSWNVEGAVAQSAYQIVAISNGEQILDTGKVISSDMTGISCALSLSSRQCVQWQVRLWDENENCGDWSEASFEMGLLRKEDWKATWITGNYKVNKKKRYPVDLFRKKFNAADVVKARLYATACGLYEGELNGQRIGNFVFAPGVTDYRRRVQYQLYDVLHLLKNGENTIVFQLADGWYRGGCGALGARNQYGTETKLLVQLELTHADSSVTTIGSDDSWDWCNDGPIRFADNKDGEIVDANMIPSFSDKAKLASHPIVPTASNNVPVTEHEHFKPAITRAPNGRQLLDFGQNIAGYVAFRVNARKEQKITLRFGEMLDGDGNFTQKNIQINLPGVLSPLQKIEYTCKEGHNEYKTRFGIFGFRYAEVESEIELEEVEAIAVYSDIERTGFFNCSNELINRFVDATVWSTKDNHLDVPTDCPTRERQGWSGDAQIFFDTASLLFDYASFSKKFLNDLYDYQDKAGRLAQIVPYAGVPSPLAPMNGSVGWGDAGILIPYRFWKRNGDVDILKQYYAGMCRYADFMMTRIGKNAIYAPRPKVDKEHAKYIVNAGRSYGEWAEPEDVSPTSWTNTFEIHTEVSTAYTSYVLGIMAQISEELGHTEDAKKYKTASQKVKKAYQALVRTEKHTLDTDQQARLVRPLHMDLLDESQRRFAEKRLIEALEHYDWRLGTGFLSTPLILEVLEEIDLEAAYRLLENEQLPGWLYMSKQGATTVWECWEGPDAQAGVASLNHYSKGAVCQWLFESVCGIRIAGKNQFAISPKPGGSLNHANAKVTTVFGTVESGWKKENGQTEFTLSVPGNCTALMHLPNGEEQLLTAGSYTFRI